MRSPSSAPPVNGLDGSTARMPTVFCCARKRRASSLTSVLLPAPGGPVTPMRHARPTRGYTAASAAAKRGSPFSAHEIMRDSALRSPRVSRSAMSAAVDTAFLSRQQRARDDQALDVGRALVDLGDARVAEQALDDEVVGVARAAVDLQALVGAVVRRARREELRLRRLLRARLAAVAQPGRAAHEQPRRLELRRHVGELPLNGL